MKYLLVSSSTAGKSYSEKLFSQSISERGLQVICSRLRFTSIENDL